MAKLTHISWLTVGFMRGYDIYDITIYFHIYIYVIYMI